MEYVAIGPRFSNIILQVLLVVGTTSAGEVLDSMALRGVSDVSLHVPSLKAEEVVRVLRDKQAVKRRGMPMVRRCYAFCSVYLAQVCAANVLHVTKARACADNDVHVHSMG